MHMPAMNVPSSTAIDTADDPSTSCRPWNQMISYISAAQPLPRNISRTIGKKRSVLVSGAGGRGGGRGPGGARAAAAAASGTHRERDDDQGQRHLERTERAARGAAAVWEVGSSPAGFGPTAIGASTVFSAGGNGVGARQ